jgi:hypothetical protein
MSVVTPSLRAAIAVPGWAKNELWRKARAVPSLDLRFADNKSLTDATTGSNLVTFTRRSSGTYVGSDGVLRTAVTNLLLQSNGFDTTWVNSNSSETAAAEIAPDGTNTAWEIKDTLDVSTAIHSIYQNFTSVTGTTYTFSVWAKAGTLPGIVLSLPTSAFGANLAVRFDLQIGTIISASAGTTNSIVAYSDGWYRLAVTATATSSASGQWQFRIDNGSGGSYQGDGTGTILIWGAQLEQSSTVGEYIPTTSNINSAPRFDHNPTTGESLGLLVEEQRTNNLLQSEDFSSTWTLSNIAVTANSVVAPDGTTTADTIAPPADGLTVTRFLRQNLALTTQQAYTLSVFVKVGTAITNGIALYVTDSTATNNFRSNFNLINLTTGGTSVGWATPTATIVPYPNGWYRCVLSGVTSTAHTGLRVQIYLTAFVTVPDTYGSIHIWGAQLEAGAFPTSYIPTTAAAVTRNADVASITGSAFSGWYNSTAGTMRSQWVGAVNGCRPFHCEDAGQTNAERFAQRIASNFLQTEVRSNGVTTNRSASGAGVVTYPAIITSCAAYDATNCVVAFRGDVSSNATADGGPECGEMFIGSYRGNATFANGPIARLTYWPQLFPSSTLSVLAP